MGGKKSAETQAPARVTGNKEGRFSSFFLFFWGEGGGGGGGPEGGGGERGKGAVSQRFLAFLEEGG